MTTTAFALQAEELKLSADQRNFALAMLRASPVASRSEETLIPLEDLVHSIETGDKSLRNVRQLLDELMKQKRIDTAGGGYHFYSVLSAISWTNDSKYLRFQLNRQFCIRLDQISQAQQINPF